jgi:hypothetical protein
LAGAADCYGWDAISGAVIASQTQKIRETLRRSRFSAAANWRKVFFGSGFPFAKGT